MIIGETIVFTGFIISSTLSGASIVYRRYSRNKEERKLRSMIIKYIEEMENEKTVDFDITCNQTEKYFPDNVVI